MIIKPEDLSVNRSIVMIDNPEYHPKLKGIPMIVMGIRESNYKQQIGWSITLFKAGNPIVPEDCDEYNQKINYLKPIPLTEEVLVDWCGFEKINSNVPNLCRKEFIIGYMNIRFDSIDGIRISPVYSGSAIPLPDIKYLHQLQNLYYSLKQTELIITIPTNK